MDGVHNFLVERDKGLQVCKPIGEQGWHSGESTRLPLVQGWLGFNSRTLSHMWVEFVIGSRPCSERFFSGYTGFPLSSTEPSLLNFNSTWKVFPIGALR